jgi:tetratricopeptide (TPR) repeat protein
VELLLHRGLLYQRMKEYPAAEESLRKILTLPADSYPVGLDLGLLGYKTRHALAELFAEQERLEEAEAEWRAALAEQPTFGPVWVGLAALELARRRPSEAAALLERAKPSDPLTRRRAERVRKAILQAAGSSRTPAMPP